MSALFRSLFLAALLALSAGAQAANVELTFGTLPSAQGWSDHFPGVELLPFTLTSMCLELATPEESI